MDLYSFINSDAIANYLRKIRYCFSSKEAAWLIYQCKKITMQKKHEAWEWLIDNMPDCELEERVNCLHWESLHDLMTDLIHKIVVKMCEKKISNVSQYIKSMIWDHLQVYRLESNSRMF